MAALCRLMLLVCARARIGTATKRVVNSWPPESETAGAAGSLSNLGRSACPAIPGMERNVTNPVNDNPMRIVRPDSHSHAPIASDGGAVLSEGRPAISLINLFVMVQNALIGWWRRRRTYDEFMALDDRALADIGLRRSQIRAVVDAMYQRAELRPVVEAALGTRAARWDHIGRNTEGLNRAAGD
jgi:uncharacterized protein YjiS (DUF1127 family)